MSAPSRNGDSSAHSESCQASWAEMVYDHPVDDLRPIKVICIGAGISGIVAGVRFPQMIKNIDFVIYEKNSDVGGTWLENRYPGVRCDIPSAAYQFTFESNTQWREYYASGPEIQRYLVNVAKKYGVYQYCRFNRRFDGAHWDEKKGQWLVRTTNLVSGAEAHDEADVLITASGILNRWKWPDIPGWDSYKGKRVHTADWKDDIKLDENMSVALIGAGSSGVQVLPTIQPLVKHIDHYMKGRNWISPLGAGFEELAARKVETGNFEHSQEELEKFRRNIGSYKEFRQRIEDSLNAAQLAAFMGTQPQKMFQQMTYESMAAKLKDRPDILSALIPDFPVGCRRLTPGPGYLEACIKENVEYISTSIKKITEQGIETVDGKERKVDLIICATGFDVSRQGEFDIVGRNGKTLDEIWQPHPEAYLSICPPHLPNLFMFLGPNGGPGAGSTIHMIEWVGEYIVKCVQKIQREYIKTMVVSERANKAFSQQVDEYFKKTVFAQPCRSWYKRGEPTGRLVTPWPGSGVHAHRVLANPRWEDFEYSPMTQTGENAMAWLGNGLTLAQHEGTATTDYLDTVQSPKVVDPNVDTGDVISFDQGPLPV
ncbi:hypothetical protein PV11_03501 [Exophiala sideris]|uniref:L-ornithine N(5)-oxygenase n=1 Tax=Exophiala sideris TaxID=1016849 RepID=A0A0D1Z329_9EURO|nr:hypothetical protein PV11_03501 [Exophiala sideris]